MTSYNDPFPSCDVNCSQAAFLLEPCLFLLFGLIEGCLSTSTGDISVNFTHQKGTKHHHNHLHISMLVWMMWFFLRLFGYELSTQWKLQWSASCFFLEVGLGDRARPGQWINGGINKNTKVSSIVGSHDSHPQQFAMPAWGHLFVELEPLLPVLICFQGVGIPHHHPGEIRVGKMRQVKRADSKTRKGRKKNILTCWVVSSPKNPLKVLIFDIFDV